MGHSRALSQTKKAPMNPPMIVREKSLLKIPRPARPEAMMVAHRPANDPRGRRSRRRRTLTIRVLRSQDGSRRTGLEARLVVAVHPALELVQGVIDLEALEGSLVRGTTEPVQRGCGLRVQQLRGACPFGGTH